MTSLGFLLLISDAWLEHERQSNPLVNQNEEGIW